MKAVIIEDEHLIAKELQSRINSIAGDVEVVEVLPSLKTARKWFMQHAEPDLLFMDIQLGDGLSFELFNEFTLTCPVIFVTAYDEYAIRAFKVNGADYLLKPVDNAELEKAIDKCRRLAGQGKTGSDLRELIEVLQNPGKHPSLYKEQFIVNVRHSWKPIKTNDIACFMKENLHYLFCFTGEKYMLDYNTLEEVEELLDPKLFYRANRQYIIHLHAIQSVKPHENQKLTVTLQAPLKIEVDISREKAPSFKKWFDR
ncbi:MAG: response regulator transcription factor [Williamsia sp.]|nr:response regulator transcription factor [Williamsia sp.]